MTTTPASEHGHAPRLTPPMTLAVYAPFGTDATLSSFPDGKTTQVTAHPLVRNLQAVADAGVNVFALVDRVGEGTSLIEIPAGRSADLTVDSRHKLDMNLHRTLSDFVGLAQQRFPAASLVLTFEGHGAGFLPDLDLKELARLKESGSNEYEWRESDGVQRLFHSRGPQADKPASHMGAPILPIGNPTLPIGNPTLPTGHMAISTWALGEGLRTSGAPKIAVIHFNNCFNMSVEVLHTVAPYAEYATGYCNYNFFTAGEAYPQVFGRAAALGSCTPEQLAQSFAAENHKVLLEAGHEPTVAGTVALARMHGIAQKVDALSDALLADLRAAAAQDRPLVVARIQEAIVAAQQYDSRSDYVLAAPDELTDLDSLATELHRRLRRRRGGRRGRRIGHRPLGHQAVRRRRRALDGQRFRVEFLLEEPGDERVPARPAAERHVGLALAVLPERQPGSHQAARAAPHHRLPERDHLGRFPDRVSQGNTVRRPVAGAAAGNAPGAHEEGSAPGQRSHGCEVAESGLTPDRGLTHSGEFAPSGLLAGRGLLFYPYRFPPQTAENGLRNDRSRIVWSGRHCQRNAAL